MYHLLIDTLINSKREKDLLFSNENNRLPAVQKKADWAQKWVPMFVHFRVKLMSE
jgi:hypothetical protein